MTQQTTKEITVTDFEFTALRGKLRRSETIGYINMSSEELDNLQLLREVSIKGELITVNLVMAKDQLLTLEEVYISDEHAIIDTIELADSEKTIFAHQFKFYARRIKEVKS